MTMESDHVKRTTETLRNCADAEYDDSKLLVEAKTHHPSSISSVSSSFSRSSLEIDISDDDPSNGSPRESKCDTDPPNVQDSIASPDCNVQTPEWSMLSTSPPVGIDDHLLQMQSPSIQTMGHPPGYDPNRIPSSVFATKVVNASDWSCASNESLFSIHMGNGSLSREVWKSGELPRIEEWDNSQSSCSSLPPVVEVPANEEVSPKSSNASRDGTMVPEPTKTMSSHRLSDASARSNSSFAFPVLVNDGGKSSALEGVEEKAAEESQLQTQDSKTPQRSSIARWFSWSSCLPRCC